MNIKFRSNYLNKKVFSFSILRGDDGHSSVYLPDRSVPFPPKKRIHRYRSEDHVERVYRRRRIRVMSLDNDIPSIQRMGHSCQGDIEQFSRKSIPAEAAASNPDLSKTRMKLRPVVTEIRKKFAQKSLTTFSSTVVERNLSPSSVNEYDENWGKPFTVTLNPGDENLPIKIISRFIFHF